MTKKISNESAGRIKRAVERVEAMPFGGKGERLGPVPSQRLLHVAITSTTTTDGFYPGTIYTYDASTGAYTAVSASAGAWIDTANGETLSIGVYYRAEIVGRKASDNKVIAQVINAGGGSGAAHTVAEVDGTPSYTDVNSWAFDQADGFVVSQPGAGQARIDIQAASQTQAGIVSTGTQTIGGAKTFSDLLSATGSTVLMTSLVVGIQASRGIALDIDKMFLVRLTSFGVTDAPQLVLHERAADFFRMVHTGVGGRLAWEGRTTDQVDGGSVTNAIYLKFDGSSHRLDLTGVIGGLISSTICYACQGQNGITATSGGVTFTGGLLTGGFPGSFSVGDAIGGGTSGSVLFVDGSGNLAQDNANLAWDDSTNTLTARNIRESKLNVLANSRFI